MYENIPEELRKLHQWVCVKADSKVPMKAWGYGAASSTDPTTWASFDLAREAVENGSYDYLGFVFADNGIVGIDIDDGYDEYGVMTPLANYILSTCESYTERSRSGRGFHIFVKGDLPFKGKNNLAGVEIYKASRFFIMTEDSIISDTVREAQDAIDHIVEKYFPEVVREKTNSYSTRVYNPEWVCPKGCKRVKVRPHYPTIPDGCRNICLTSLAGMMHSIGYTKGQIYRELRYANDTACNPPLSLGELQAICNSVTRYRR